MKMQDVNFRSVDDMMDYLPQDEKEITQVLRELVKDCIPHVREKLAYNVPFYSLNKNICYIWPGSIPWGKSTFQGVQFGFTSGNLLQDEVNFLEAGKRKHVRTRLLKKLHEDDLNMLRTFLFEAVEVDSL